MNHADRRWRRLRRKLAPRARVRRLRRRVRRSGRSQQRGRVASLSYLDLFRGDAGDVDDFPAAWVFAAEPR